jgi:hypothetical protein
MHKCVERFAMPEVVRHVTSVQAEMSELAKGILSESDLNELQVLVRLAVEFHHYVQLSCDHHFCLEYISESIFAGLDSFMSVAQGYRILVGAEKSRVEWDQISVATLKQRFARSFDDFAKENVFERKCRLLLDLFKLQIVFAGVAYE